MCFLLEASLFSVHLVLNNICQDSKQLHLGVTAELPDEQRKKENQLPILTRSISVSRNVIMNEITSTVSFIYEMHEAPLNLETTSETHLSLLRDDYFSTEIQQYVMEQYSTDWFREPKARQSSGP